MIHDDHWFTMIAGSYTIILSADILRNLFNIRTAYHTHMSSCRCRMTVSIVLFAVFFDVFLFEPHTTPTCHPSNVRWLYRLYYLLSSLTYFCPNRTPHPHAILILSDDCIDCIIAVLIDVFLSELYITPACHTDIVRWLYRLYYLLSSLTYFCMTCP